MRKERSGRRLPAASRGGYCCAIPRPRAPDGAPPPHPEESVPRPAPQPRRSSLLPFYVILGVVALGGAFVLFRQQGGGGKAANTLTPVTLTPAQLQSVPGISKGRADAPVQILEFADFQCPGCRQFALFSEPLVQEWIDNGTVRFTWYEFPLTQIHKNAVLTARGGRCANEQNKFWEYHEATFAHQAEWSEADDAAKMLGEYAAGAGLDRAAFDACLLSDKYQKEVSDSYQLGVNLGVEGTPTLIVNNKRVERTPSTRADWQALIEAETRSAPVTAPSLDGASGPVPVAPAPAADSAAP